MDEWHLVVGLREEWGQETPSVLEQRDRRQHLYTVGKSGTGKTTFLHNLIVQDICSGQGVGVIDPHGDLASDLLDYIPRQRIEDVVYFNLKSAVEGQPVGVGAGWPNDAKESTVV